MPNVMVFCRRWVTWGAPPMEREAAAQAEFKRCFRVDGLQGGWQRANPRIPLSRYREELQALARKSWEASGAAVVLHQCPAEVT